MVKYPSQSVSMAAKLKKRALAEYQSQVVESDDEKKIQKSSKKLKLLLPPRRTDSTSSSVTSSRRLSSCAGESISGIESLIHQVVLISQTISDASLPISEAKEVAKKLSNALLTKNETDISAEIRCQVYLCLSNVVKAYSNDRVSLEFHEDWLSDFFDDDTKSALLSLLSNWFKSGRTLNESVQGKLLTMIKKDLKNCLDHQIKISALKVLGNGTHILSAQDHSLASNIMTIINRHTKNQDPRVRQAAFEALFNIHKNGHKLDSGTYQDLCQALTDDYEGVRIVGLKLIHVMAISYPEEQVRDPETGNNVKRLIDDAFGKICFAVQDLSVQVREMSVKLIGTLEKVSPEFLEQTLDKKLMSNMRTKKSAHERQAQIVASGEWSSGKKWADDAPR